MFVLMTEIENIMGYAPARTVNAHFGKRFYYWLGASGERYLHTVFPLKAGFNAPGANLIIVRVEPNAERTALFVGRIGQLSDRQISQLQFSHGANELHIHLMATGDAAADKVAADLSRRHLHREEGKNEPHPAPKPLPAVFFTNVSF